ncbi:MAG TPA: carboxypeptidase-like regulatory domain-containing protein, partial [Flavitalea sp.]|nr:carboxypeptidase-like regulatory domain-containing protein [Flavitalea sp.]
MRKVLWLCRQGKFLPVVLLLQLVSFITVAQVKIAGKVTGPGGSALPGISVQIANTNLGSSTNAAGEFNIDAILKPGKYTINFTGIGFRPQNKTIEVTSSNEVNVDAQLSEDVLMLNDVVVTGTTVATSKKKLANAVSTVSARDIQYSASTGIDGALQGKVAGAQITQNSGNPAGGISVRLRGPSTIVGSSDPLYIVDGVIVNNDSRELIDLGGYAQNRLVDINPADIDHIEI